MADTIRLGEIGIAVTLKDIKHVHLSVHPPSGRVTLAAPRGTRPEVAHAYAVSRLGWIRNQQERLRGQARETPRQFVERESHCLGGRRHLLSVREEDARPSVRLSHRRIMLTVRPGSSRAKREAVMHEWHKLLLHHAVAELIRKWEQNGVPAHRPRSIPGGSDARGEGDHEPPNKRIQSTRGKRRAPVGRRGARG